MKHTRASLIAAIQEYNRIYGTPPAAMDWNVAMARSLGRQDIVDRFYDDACWPHFGSVVYRFGSWNKAIEAAGLTPRQPGQKRGDVFWEPTAVLDALWQWHQDHGSPPRMIDWPYGTADHPSYSQVASMFGTWGRGLRAAGLEPQPTGFQPSNQHWAKRKLK